MRQKQSCRVGFCTYSSIELAVDDGLNIAWRTECRVAGVGGHLHGVEAVRVAHWLGNCRLPWWQMPPAAECPVWLNGLLRLTATPL